MNKSAFCCFYEAYPPASGAASVSYNLAKCWRGDSLLLQLGSSDQRFVTDDGVQVATLVGASESRLERLIRLSELISRIVAEIVSAGSSIIVLEGASWVLYHWLLALRIRHVRPQATIVYHSHNVEFLLRSQRHGRAVAMLTRWAEAQLIEHADIATAVSEVDQGHFADLYGIKPMLLPNGVDVERFANPDPDTVDRLKKLYRLDQHTLLFAGFYAYHPNREAIDFLVRSVMPKLREQYPSATLALTGGGAPYDKPWIKNVGSIAYDDFASFVAACGIAVAPIFSGSGTRLKILEALAAGIPVVATEKAAEGLSLIHGEDILFASDRDEFISCLAAVFEHPGLKTSLRAQARATIEKCSWPHIIANLEGLLSAGKPSPLLQDIARL